MLLEAACDGDATAVELPLARDAQGVWITDWAPLLPPLLDSAHTVSARAGIFHASLGAAIMQQARQARELHGVTRVGLSGGVFQNRVLTEQVCRQLQSNGFTVDMPDVIPLNDAGLCYGQVIEFGAAATRAG
jgi:hydrogenase maturation protein HypF